jgi:hypothetical protein
VFNDLRSQVTVRFVDIFILNLLKLLHLRKIKPITLSKTCFVVTVLIAEKWNVMIFADFSSINLSLSVLMRKYYAIFGRVRGKILPLEVLYRVVQILFLNVSIT